VKRLPFLGLLVVCVLALAGCGGHHHATSTTTATTTTAPPQPPVPLKGIPCTASNYAMQCAGAAAIAAPNPPKGLLSVPAVPITYGTDTNGGAATIAGSSLTHFDCSYLSGVPGKDWTTGDLAAWHAQGKPTCVVFEQSASQAENGYDQGVRDAHAALAEANSLGIPSYVPIHFAVDTGASGLAVKDYFLGTKAVLGLARNGAYGSYFVIRDLVEWGIITNEGAWQTRAWSEGLVWPQGCEYQYAIPPMANTSIDGEGVDLDISRCVDWGQWPYAAAPPVNPEHYTWLPNTPARTFRVERTTTRPCKAAAKGCHLVHARPRSAAHTFDNLGCVRDKTTHHFKRYACQVKAQHLELLAGRYYSIAHRTRDLKHPVSKPRWDALVYKVGGHTTTLGGAYRQMSRRANATAPIKSW
jgi:hypothetical protein